MTKEDIKVFKYPYEKEWHVIKDKKWMPPDFWGIGHFKVETFCDKKAELRNDTKKYLLEDYIPTQYMKQKKKAPERKLCEKCINVVKELRLAQHRWNRATDSSTPKV